MDGRASTGFTRGSCGESSSFKLALTSCIDYGGLEELYLAKWDGCDIEPGDKGQSRVEAKWAEKTDRIVDFFVHSACRPDVCGV